MDLTENHRSKRELALERRVLGISEEQQCRNNFRGRLFDFFTSIFSRPWFDPMPREEYETLIQVSAALAKDIPTGVLLNRPTRRKLSPAAFERRALALVELDLIHNQPTAHPQGGTEIERKIDVLEAALHRHRLLVAGSGGAYRRDAAVWQKMEQELAELKAQVAHRQRGVVN